MHKGRGVLLPSPTAKAIREGYNSSGSKLLGLGWTVCSNLSLTSECTRKRKKSGKDS